MAFLTPLKLYDLDAEDIEWLIEACKVVPTGMESSHVLWDASRGLVSIWRLGEHDGILVTKLVQHPAFKELFIMCLAGKGILAVLESAFDELKSFARDSGCQKIGCGFTRESLKQIAESRLGFSPTVTYCLAEVDNGQ